MNVQELVPTIRFRAAFDLYALKRIVDCAGCYCLLNAAGDILYVGQAVSVRRRLIEHFEGEKRHTMTTFGRVSQVVWREESPIRLNALERGWIEAVRLRDGELPPLNRTSAPT